MSVWPDLRHAARLLLKTPGFTITAIVTLALGIGASTSVFTVIDGVLLRPLPYHDSSNLLLVTAVDRDRQNTIGCLTHPRYTLIAGQNHVFAGIAAFTGDSANVTNPGDAEQVRAARVSSAFFDVLGVRPALGRAFVASDEQDASGPVVIISDSLWRRKFGGRPDVIGRAMTLDASTRSVVGVLPAAFGFGLLGSHVDVWTPRIDELSLASPEQLRNGTCYLNAVARLAGGADRDRAQAQMDVLNRRYRQEFGRMPDTDPRRVVLAQPLQERIVAGFRPMLATITAGVAVLMAIACANVAGLMLARGLARRRELAVRTTLGAGRVRLAAQLLSESLLLAVSGGLVGFGVSLWGTRLLAVAVAGILPRSGEIGAAVDSRILSFALALSLATGLVAGLAPAFQISRAGLLAVLRTDDRGSIGHRRQSMLRGLLVAAQIALSLVLLVAAGLLVRSFWKLQAIDSGFDPAGRLTMNLSLPPAKYSTRVQMVDFYQRLLSKVEGLPGIEGASLASALPVNPSRMTPILAEGQPAVPLQERPIVVIQTFLGPYAKTMGIPMVKGRGLDERDVADGPPVVVVNEAFARKFFGNENPIGRHVVLGRRAAAAEIVGVIGDVRNTALTAPAAPEIDVPFAQLPWASMNLTIRTSGDPTRAVGPIRAVVAGLDRDLPLTGVQGMDQLLASARVQPKMISALLGLFSLSSLVLAVVGLYGLLTYSVGQRTQELGVRMALGATAADLTRLVVRQGLRLAALGLAVGLAGAFAVTRWMASMLYGVSATDAVTFAAGPAVFLALAAIASWVPARRAGRADPCEVLRG